ncbi:uncharacterized protein LOC112517919 [Cynara cardunculus var. scolymus]|uniref:uncharacterized protein LOC112517919 n=1 Tax=Cynara cardunculus var. scolymus TaxID=59895 RepID=UPI000D626202|nr:uncharacterized protein LOC112517919 [Cynara cardunculus var. scolymus]
MASTVNLHSLYPRICYSSGSYSCKSQILAFGPSRLPCESLLKSKKRSMIPIVQNRKIRSRIYAAQSSFFRVLQTAYKVGKDGIEAGTSLVPVSIPRPIARISVAVVGATVALFLLKSFLSTAFFVLATMGLIYSAFIALNKDEGPTGGGGGGEGATTTSTEESLEEARRIMEKYK